MHAPINALKPARKKREWAARLWLGCDFAAWAKLLVRNRLAIWHPAYWHMAGFGTALSAINTALRGLQESQYGAAIRRTPIRHAPLFVLGHWRSGTTFLHELLIRDARHTFPTTLHCFVPHHFLISEELVKFGLWWMMPDRRPMDNMPIGWDRPQEDEFALCLLGQRSPYTHIAFPNNAPLDEAYYDLDTVSAREREAWKKALLGFVRRLTYRDPRRVVLKSPPHSFRIKILMEMFPDARFVHIVRNPYVLFPSTMRMWTSLFRTQGLQPPRFAGQEEYVLNTFVRLYEKIEEGKKQIGPGRFHELKYEDLTADPLGQMRSLYERLELGGFDEALPRMKEYLDSVSGYETNTYEMTPQQRAKVTERWGHVIRQYGYRLDSDSVEQTPPLAG